MEILRNQPVRFWEDGSRDTGWPLLYDAGDPYQFQLKATDVYSEYSDWLSDGDFFSGTGWTIGVTGVSITGGALQGTATSNGSVTNTYVMVKSRIYRVVFTVVTNTGTITFGGKSTRTFGTFTVYYQPTLTTTEQFSFTLASGGSYNISSVELHDVTDNFAFRSYVTNTAGSHEYTITGPVRTNDRYTYDLGLSGNVSGNGLYMVKLLDPSQNLNSQCYLSNGFFTNKNTSSDFVWLETLTMGNTFSYAQAATYFHAVTWDATALVIGDTLSQEGAVKTSTEYTVSFRVNAVSNASVSILLGGASSASYNTTGVKSFTLTSGSNQQFAVIFSNSLATASISISEISVTMTNVADYMPDYESNLFSLEANADCDSVLIRAVSDNYGLGLELSDFIPTVRVRSDIIEPEYNSESRAITGVSGRKSTYYFERRKAQMLHTAFAHEYLHDFLSILPGFDNFYVDNDEYTAEDDSYRVNWVMQNYGEGQMRIGLRTQDAFANNKNTSFTGIDITASGSFLVDTSGNFIVDPSGDNIIAP